MPFPLCNPIPAALAARRDWSEAMGVIAGWKSPVLRVPVGVPLLVVRDAAAAHEVLVADAGSYGHPWIVRNIMGDALGKVLFTKEGEEWSASRRLVAPAFAHANLDSIGREIVQAIEDELDTWVPGQIDDIQEPLTRLTMRVACRALLGFDPNRHPAGKAVETNFTTILEWIAHRFSHIASPPAVVPTRRNRALNDARAGLAGGLQSVLEERRASERLRRGSDVLALLLAAQNDGQPLSDDDIINEAIGFLFAGHETTAGTLAWALYELATHNEVQQRLTREADEVARVASGPHDATQRLAFTGRVVDEVLRLYPPGVGIARVATRGTRLLGERVRRHTIVLIAVHPMHRSPAWPDPDEFAPERAFPASQQRPAQGDPAYLPFGWGPRRCLGARFATTEARLALAAVCRRWTLTYDRPQPPQLAVIPSLRPKHGIPLTLERRGKERGQVRTRVG